MTLIRDLTRVKSSTERGPLPRVSDQPLGLRGLSARSRSFIFPSIEPSCPLWKDTLKVPSKPEKEVNNKKCLEEDLFHPP